MGYAVGPSTERTFLRRVMARLDEISGFPRVLSESEVARIGPTPPGGWAEVRTDALVAIYVHDDTGAAQLHGAIAVHYGREVVQMLNSRLVDPGDGSGKRTVGQIITDRGWVIRTDAEGLPGQPEAWTRLPHRDAEPGSATGTPIPEGEE